MAAESNTAVCFLIFLFASFRFHFAAIRLNVLGTLQLAAQQSTALRPLSNWMLLSCGVGLVRLGEKRLL